MEEWAKGVRWNSPRCPFFADASEQLNGAFLVFAPPSGRSG